MFFQLRRIQLDTSGIPVSHVPEVTSLSMQMSSKELLLVILPSCHLDQLKIICHLADLALHSPGHQLLCFGGATGGGPSVKQ